MIGWTPEIDGDKCHLLVHVERGRRAMMLLVLHDAEREGDAVARYCSQAVLNDLLCLRP